jgi:broad specificity phosphatase PhoE
MADNINYTITFLRHGESVGNLENRYQGHVDFPLTETGRLQAQALADRWLHEKYSFNQVISSPLLRARQTAETICAALHSPLEVDDGWKEIDNGLIAGMDIEEAGKVVPKPKFMTPYMRYGRTGESRLEVFLRAGRNIQKLMDRPPGTYLVVAHGGILNFTLYSILGIPVQADSSGPRFMFKNTTFATFVYEPDVHKWWLVNFDFRPQWKDE